jgi:hypothetical protein
LGDFGSSGSGNGQFATPAGIAVKRGGATGNGIYVVDSGNDRVQVFNENGIFQGSFGSSGTGDGEFSGPTALAVTDDSIYVADNGNSRVQMLTNPIGAIANSLIVNRDQVFVPLAFQATAGVSNSSTTTYADTVNEDTTLPAGTWTIIAVWSQQFSATAVAHDEAEGPIVVGATTGPDRGTAELSGGRTQISATETVTTVNSGGSTAINVQPEFRRDSTFGFTGTPISESGVLTLSCVRTA